MRCLRTIIALFAILLFTSLFTSSALAQNGSAESASTSSDEKPRTVPSETNRPPDPCATAAAAGGEFCQLAQRRGGPPLPRRMGHPGRIYAGYPGRPSPWVGEGHPGHALIGALIGGTVGATVGYNTHPPEQRGPNVGGSILLGGIGAVIGGVIGNSIGEGHFHRYHRQSWPDEDDLDARAKRKDAQQSADVKPLPTPQSEKKTNSAVPASPAP